jgi:hypothetical protein
MNPYELGAWMVTLPDRYKWAKPIACALQPIPHPKDPTGARRMPTTPLMLAMNIAECAPGSPKQIYYTAWLAIQLAKRRK